MKDRGIKPTMTKKKKLVYNTGPVVKNKLTPSIDADNECLKMLKALRDKRDFRLFVLLKRNLLYWMHLVKKTYLHHLLMGICLVSAFSVQKHRISVLMHASEGFW